MLKYVFITKQVRKTLIDEIALTDNQFETGGVLVGYYTLNNEVVVTHASSCGPNAKRSRNSIVFDTTYCNKFISEFFTQSNGCLTYIGDWHSHVEPILIPSYTDKKQIAMIANDVNACLSTPIMLIGYSDQERFDCSIYTFENNILSECSKVIFIEKDFDVESRRFT